MRLQKMCMLRLRCRKVALRAWAHWSPLATLGPGLCITFQWGSSGGTNGLGIKCQAVHDLWGTEINQSVSHRVFLRISLSCTEKADMPNEQMCIYLAHLSGFNWSKMIAKLSGIRGMLRALGSVREGYYNSVFVQNHWLMVTIERRLTSILFS